MNSTTNFSSGRMISEMRRIVIGRRRTMLLSALIVLLLVMVPAYYTQYFMLRTVANRMLWDAGDYLPAADYSMKMSVPSIEMVIFTVALFVLGIVAASLMCGQLGTKAGRCDELMIPASAAEKYAARWLVYVPGFLIVFFAATILTDLSRPLVFSLMAPRDVSLYTSYHYLSQYYDLGKMIWREGAVYMFIVSLFSLGAFVWPRNTLLKTVSLIVAMALLAILWFLVWSATFATDADPIPEWVGRHLEPVLLVLAVINWALAYMRLTETDLLPHTGPYNQTTDK